MTLGERLSLIVITDHVLAQPRSIVEVVGEALVAGAPAVQLRSKALSPRDSFGVAVLLRSLTEASGALFFVNDRLDLALAARADGVHLGPDDLPVADARSAVPPDFLIGYSTDDPVEALSAQRDGADYLGCGTVFPTTSKRDAGATIGTAGLAKVVEAVSIPVVGIGGISPERVREVAATGAVGSAAIGAVMTAGNVPEVVKGLLEPWMHLG